ncbi:tetratricopeptide repeat protein [Azospirillum sp. SYSU D00513]|uniref:tetratricopeptide repeat protein n=1 Tax=Azospirillum sp. SYSU D00513 TaxID=2812561 RepID=UPI001FFF1817|nr:tetratricopeptide repeat protein [Azospirillum sp. SYSU D00513]
MSGPALLLAEALGHHRAGALDAAETLYRRILDASPGHADALHLLGVLTHQRGHHAEAARLIGEAIRVDGTVADYHRHLGLVLLAMDRAEEAAACHGRALQLRPDHAEARFNLGVALAALGRKEQAAAQYAEAARLRPDFAEAHLNLGAVLQDLGRAGEAVASHRRAAELMPADPRPWSNLSASLRHLGRAAEAGEAMRQALARGGAGDATGLAVLAGSLHAEGRLAEAAEAYVESLRIDPGAPLVLNNFGLLLQDLGQPEDAAACFDGAVALKPDFVEAHDNLGSVRRGQGRAAEAVESHRKALAHRPDMAAAWNNLGNALKDLNRTGEAFPAWRMAVLLDPGLASVWSNLGNGLREREDFAGAAAHHRRSLRLAPGQPMAANNLGHALQGQGRFMEAARWFRRALALDPAYGEAMSNLGLAEQRLGRTEAAEASYGRALLLARDLALAHFNRGLLRLERGDFTGGWPGYAWRFASGQVGAGRQPAIPAWRGEDLVGKRLLVWGEQGVGDTMLFASVCEDAVARAGHVVAGHVVIETDRRLVPLLARSFPQATVRAQAVDARGRETLSFPDCALHTPVGSLARVFRRSLAAFPSRPSWLVPDPARLALWRERLAALGPGLKVGIGWRSQLMTAERRTAYTILEDWAPLFRVPGLVFVNLQYGDCAEEIERAEARFEVRLHRWSDLDLKDDFEAAAALVSNLDLVISPAMSAGELAGALGVPVWRFGGRDWTQLGTGVRPWFPSMRLWQPRPGEALPDVLARMARELAAGAESRPGPLTLG